MAGNPKKRVQNLTALAEKFKDDPEKQDLVGIYLLQVQWILEREKQRNLGTRLSSWVYKNPEPFKTHGLEYSSECAKLGDSELKEDINQPVEVVKKSIKDPNSNDWYRNTTIGKHIDVPIESEIALKKIKEAKEKIRIKAQEAYRNSVGADELKNLAQIAKRLDAEEKKIIFSYDFNQFDDYLFQDIQDRVTTPPFHNEMFQLYQHSSRACVICPRGHAKSTNARKYLIHQIVNKKTNYVVIVGASEEMAGQNLRWIRDQFTDNRHLIQIYGFLKNNDKWAETEFEIVFRNEKGEPTFKTKVVAKGAGQKIRGMNEKGRPDLFYIDDLEEDEQVESKERREKLRQWFLKALLPSRAKNGRLIITGTILHLDSLLRNISLNKIKDHISWDVLFYQAINVDADGTEYALWPEHKPMSELKALREADPITFSQEYQNNPRAGISSTFSDKYYQYYDPKDLSFDSRGKKISISGRELNIMVTTDYAYAKHSGADYTVYMATGMDRDSKLYVLEYLRFREQDPLEQVRMFFDFILRWHCDYVVMEEQQYQHAIKRFMEIEMEARKRFFYIHGIKRTGDSKFLRIKGLQSPIRTGNILWLREHLELEEELSQVTSSGLGNHDDVLDCLSDAWHTQLEANENVIEKEPEINTIEWLAAQGLWGDEDFTD